MLSTRPKPKLKKGPAEIIDTQVPNADKVEPSEANVEASRLDAGIDTPTETCEASSSSDADDESTMSLLRS
jgi:hypothetical protein